ncbi:hypothetical protein [Streptomyces justiciae]|uniref:hypothetical protein n=1 Tax=Streptomyces justiciae TaxID=2780140 RepID=UPI002117EA36|nr:hypothetical protein [Streptomyces justiciae]MCW8383934.1 hypothetical protein [Streptomyces justiciae]
MIRDAVTCDRPNCRGMMLEPLDYEHDTFEAHVIASGWTYDATGHTCPACMLGTGPVHERGECPVCGGRICTLHGQDECLSCERKLPAGDGEDEW